MERQSAGAVARQQRACLVDRIVWGEFTGLKTKQKTKSRAGESLSFRVFTALI